MCRFYFGTKLWQRISRFYFYLILRICPFPSCICRPLHGHCIVIKILLYSSRSQQPLTFHKRPDIHLIKSRLCWWFWGRDCSLGLMTASRGRKWPARASTQTKNHIMLSLSGISFFPSSSYFIYCSRKSSVLLFFTMAATLHFDYTDGNIGNERATLNRIETFLFCCKWQQESFLDIEVSARVK